MDPIITGSAWVFLLACVEAIGLTLLRASPNYLIYTSLIYGLLVVPLFAISLKYKGIGMVNFLSNMFTTLLMFAIGIYIFKEKITYLKAIGIVLSFVGLGIILMAPEE